METFCLVHGAWHDDACWDLLVAELTRRGHECVTPVLPLEDRNADFEDYARVVIERLDGHAAPVLVGHSMSSAVAPLVAVERPVKLLVYLCPAMAGFAPLPGEPSCQRAGYLRPPIDAVGRCRWPHDGVTKHVFLGSYADERWRRRASTSGDRLPPQKTTTTFLSSYREGSAKNAARATAAEPSMVQPC